MYEPWYLSLAGDQPGHKKSTGLLVMTSESWCSESVIWCFMSLSTNFQSYREGVCLWQILPVLPCSAASLKLYRAAKKHTDTLPSHVILIPGQPVLVLSFLYWAPSEEASSSNFNVFGSTRLGNDPTISRLQGERSNHLATAAVIHGAGWVLIFY